MTTGDFLFFSFFFFPFSFFLSFILPPLSRSSLFTHSHRLEKFFVFVSLSFLSFRTIGLFFPSPPSWAPKFSPPRGCWAHTEVADGVTSSLRFWLVTQRCRSTGTPGSAGVALAGAGGGLARHEVTLWARSHRPANHIARHHQAKGTPPWPCTTLASVALPKGEGTPMTVLRATQLRSVPRAGTMTSDAAADSETEAFPSNQCPQSRQWRNETCPMTPLEEDRFQTHFTSERILLSVVVVVVVVVAGMGRGSATPALSRLQA